MFVRCQPYNNLSLRQPKKTIAAKLSPLRTILCRFRASTLLCTAVLVHVHVLSFCTRATRQPYPTNARLQDSCSSSRWSRRWSRWLRSKTSPGRQPPGELLSLEYDVRRELRTHRAEGYQRRVVWAFEDDAMGNVAGEQQRAEIPDSRIACLCSTSSLIR